MRLVEDLEEQTEGFEALAVDCAKAEAHFDKSWAQAYLQAGGPVEERKAWATFQTAEEAQAYKIAEALLRARRERLSSLRAQLEALRTLSANLRALIS